ncbi:MAG: c-type cytochrome [Proteobacteria bacterium]|nr:c-type cytochrome [Pseudomonadota bacterium]
MSNGPVGSVPRVGPGVIPGLIRGWQPDSSAAPRTREIELADRAAATLASRLVILAGLIVVLLVPTAGRSQDQSMEEIVEALQAQVDSLTNNMHLERGRKIYFQACMPCHGIRGDGRGPAAKGFDPAPRNFRRGVYKFRTTISGALPIDADLERTVRVGVPGTEMPRWKDVLSQADIKAVVQYIKAFSPWFEDPYALPLPEDILKIPEDRPFEPSLASIAAGRQLFVEQDCVKCHGENGKGDGPQADELVDDWDVPIRPGDLSRPYFKNGKRDHDIYRVFTSALNGTPMPAFDDLSDEQRWQLVDYVQSLEQRKGFVYWLFRENPNQVRHPEPENAEASNSGG